MRSSMKGAKQKRNFSPFRTGSALRTENETLTNLDVYQNSPTPLGGPMTRQQIELQIAEHQRDLEDDISLATQKANLVNAEQICIADKMRVTRRERRYGIQQTKEISCSELIKKVSKDRNILSYQLKRLVADKDGHQQLQPKKVETVEVLDDTYMFFKVATKDMLGPGKINFSYSEGQYVRANKVETLRSSTFNNAESPTSPSKPK